MFRVTKVLLGVDLEQYYLVDYQENTRVLFRDGGGSAEVVEDYSGYYPFGAVHEQESDYQNKYLNEGKELQTELGLEWSDYSLRCKDNWTGRFLGIDVLASAMPSHSPYSFGFGNPIRFSDPSGASPIDETFTDKNSGNSVDIHGNTATLTPEFWNGKVYAGNGGGNNGNRGGSGDPIYSGGKLPEVEVTAKRVSRPRRSQTDPLLRANSGVARPAKEWANRYKGSSLFDIKYEGTELLNSDGSRSGGSLRYVIDPKNGNVIDMKHFLKIGQWEATNGKWVGAFVERRQERKFPASAHHPQDYYSNELGRQFFLKHKKWMVAQDGLPESSYYFPNGVANSILEFLNNR